MDLVSITYYSSRVSYPKRSGLAEKFNHSRPNYLGHLVVQIKCLAQNIRLPISIKHPYLSGTWLVEIDFKNIYQNKACVKATRLRVVNTITILSSIVNPLGGGGGENVYDHPMNTGIFTLTGNKIFI